jgi:AraC family transcriptional activator FtrA
MDKIAPHFSTTGPLVVAIVYDGLCTFEFSIAAEVFGLKRPEMGERWYRFASAAIEPGPLRAQGGLEFQAKHGLDLLDEADLIVVPGWKGVDVAVPEQVLERLRAAWRRGGRLASICSGAFVLASTGLLAGQRAATHWRYAQALAQRHPEIEVDASVLYVCNDRVFTSAGSAAGVDLMLHIVREDFGVDAANSVARRLVMPPHRQGGQAQFIERPVAADRDARLATLLEWLRKDPTRRWSVDEMAQAAAMSTRTFLRRFTEATGMTPTEWLALTRVEEAKRLLETTALHIERVASESGFGSVQALRHHFMARVGVAPRDYRATFRKVASL